jgi:hypothetical protein
MTIPTDQQRKLREIGVEAETVEDLDPDTRGSEGVRGGAMQPYLTLEGQKSGADKGPSVPPQ